MFLACAELLKLTLSRRRPPPAFAHQRPIAERYCSTLTPAQPIDSQSVENANAAKIDPESKLAERAYGDQRYLKADALLALRL